MAQHGKHRSLVGLALAFGLAVASSAAAQCRQALALGMAAQVLDELDAVHARHVPVGEHQLDVVVAHKYNSLNLNLPLPYIIATRPIKY